MTKSRNKNYYDEWSDKIIYRIIRNHIYTGDNIIRKSVKLNYKQSKRTWVAIRDREIMESTHPAIVTQELFKNANSKIKHWGYQKGTNYGFENTKAMVLNRDNYICQHCKGRHKDSKLEVHHIIFRSQGGSDEENNLITLCHTCHKNLHNGKIKLNVKGKLKGTLKYATQMNSIRKQLFKIYPNAIETFGYITKICPLPIV